MFNWKTLLLAKYPSKYHAVWCLKRGQTRVRWVKGVASTGAMTGCLMTYLGKTIYDQLRYDRKLLMYDLARKWILQSGYKYTIETSLCSKMVDIKVALTSPRCTWHEEGIEPACHSELLRKLMRRFRAWRIKRRCRDSWNEEEKWRIQKQCLRTLSHPWMRKS